MASQPNPWDWSLLQVQVQHKVQQLLWHHNQIHEICLLQLQFNSRFNNSCGITTKSMRLKSSTIASSTQGSTTLVASQPNPWDFKSSTIASSTQGSTTLVASQPNPWDFKSSTIASSTLGSTTLVASQPNPWDFKSSTIASSTLGSTTLVASQPNPWDLSLLQLQIQLQVQRLFGPTTIYTWMWMED